MCTFDGAAVGNPIIPATGEKILDQTDHEGFGADALSLVRHYRSKRVTGVAAGPASAGLGQAWSHNHAVFLEKLGAANTAGSMANVRFGDGSERSFEWQTGTGSWLATNSADTLTVSGTGLQYKRLDDDSLWQFDAAGKLLTVTRRNGWVTTYTYSTTGTPASVAPVAGLLITVSNHFGRTLNFAYNASRQLASATAADGRVTRYGYDGTAATGRLTAVSYPGASGGTVSKTYLYEMAGLPALLTGVTDEKGVRLATYAYDTQGRGISTQHAGGADLHTVSYGTGGSVTVTDPLGTQRNYNYGITQGKLAVTGADKPGGTGNSSALSRVQDANGFITQESDFLGVNTMYTWDINRRLPLSTTKAASLPEAQTRTTQWHAGYRLPVLVTEAGKTTAYAYDTAGNRLSQTVTDTASGVSRSAGWTYNPQGLVATETDSNSVVARSYAYYASSSFAPIQLPVSPDPYIQSVSLLLHGDGAQGSRAIVDNSLRAATGMLTRNARISTTQSRFGGSSFYIPGSTDYGDYGNLAGDFTLPGDFTVEFWMKPANTTGVTTAIRLGGSGATSNDFYFWNNNLILEGSNNGAYCPASGLAGLAGTWIHVAHVRIGNTVTVYINGQAVASCPWTTTVGNANGMAFGYTNSPHAVYYDDIRVTNGNGRYTANFTPPTAAFPHIAPIVADLNETGHMAGDLQSIANAAGHVTQFTQYDRAGRVRQMVDPKGVVTDTVYTPRGWIGSVTVTPPGGTARTTAYTYDNAGQLITAALPDGTTLGYSYDAAHRLTGVTDAKGNSVTYTLDNAGNKTGEQVKDPSGNLQRNITRVYDALNRVQQVTGASN
ncbi:LamG-like jellyroll fold domain-containing protein [Polaromonas sp. YR568]|uniref:LamG-like jellyroll fold domain-containing protein n=1 Tax=Polaromonas sp. YR568 TaxID=1855301 RepID=UPI00398C1979